MTMDFYDETIARLVMDGTLSSDARTLVVCGGPRDQRVLLSLGFKSVIISNLDVRMSADHYAPYEWAFEDVESLSFDDASFDQVIVHDGLHHCASPHRALLEMYRVSSRVVLVFESRDSFAMRLAARTGLAREYEIEAVLDNDFIYGGVRNSWVPNRVYRWTEREIEKTISTFDPLGPPTFRYFHGIRLPSFWPNDPGAKLRNAVMRLARLPAKLLLKLAPSQTNRFAFCVCKPSKTHPWINSDGRSLNMEWISTKFALS